MFNEGFNITGNVKFEMNGKLIREVPNLVTTAGKGFVAASMLKTTSNSPAAMTHMSWVLEQLIRLLAILLWKQL